MAAIAESQEWFADDMVCPNCRSALDSLPHQACIERQSAKDERTRAEWLDVAVRIQIAKISRDGDSRSAESIADDLMRSADRALRRL